MRFGLEFKVLDGSSGIALGDLAKDLGKAKALLAKPEEVEGAIVPWFNGKPGLDAHYDPLLALAEQWMLKLPWLLGGDTETVFLKNSEHVFGFEPAGDILHLSFYVGAKNEVEEYVLEPTGVQLETFCEASIAVARQLVALFEKVDPQATQNSPDVRTLKEAIIEGERALKNHRQRH